MKKAVIRLTVLALVATSLVVPFTAGTAAAMPFAEDPANCYEFDIDTSEFPGCFADVIQQNIDMAPTAALDDLGELRARVVYLKQQLLWARNSVIESKALRLGLDSPIQYATASVGLATLRAQVQEIRVLLAQARADVQFARFPVTVT